LDLKQAAQVLLALATEGELMESESVQLELAQAQRSEDLGEYREGTISNCSAEAVLVELDPNLR
jgi:uncharacterized protein YdbL (DUF1318 family)